MSPQAHRRRLASSVAPNPEFLETPSPCRVLQSIVSCNDDTAVWRPDTAATTALHSVPQGSVMGPVLYSIYTADLPMTEDVETATYADDTACLASDIYPNKACQKLQTQLDKIDH